MSAEQLISTIEQVEAHEPDPTTENEADPWDKVSSDFGELRERLISTYRQAADQDGPSEEEVKDAFATLAGAWSQVAGSVSSALKEPEVREQLKIAAGSFASAVGRTISELGKELEDEPFEEE